MDRPRLKVSVMTRRYGVLSVCGGGDGPDIAASDDHAVPRVESERWANAMWKAVQQRQQTQKQYWWNEDDMDFHFEEVFLRTAALVGRLKEAQGAVEWAPWVSDGNSGVGWSSGSSPAS